MRRRVVSGIMLTLLLIGMLMLAFNIQPVRSDWTWIETIYIRADGSVEPDTAPISSVDNITYTLTDNIVGDVPEETSAIVVERNNIVVDGAGYTVRDTGVSVSTGIDLGYRSNVTLKNVEIINFGKYGINLHYSNNNALTSNTVSNNFNGIHLDSSSNNLLTGNTVSSNDNYGIVYGSSNDNVITGNTVSNNFNGISLGWSSDNLLADNIIFSNNWHGISVTSSSDNNVISGNNISSNQGRGINFHYSYDNNSTGNTISNNGAGIYVFYFSCNNTFFHNNLLNNTIQAYAEWNINTWDNNYPSGGNYWSDYEDRYPDAKELDGSGIWDIPYFIDADNQDNYPLMYPWVERKVGVEVGDWIRYCNFNVTWSSTDPNAQPPRDYEFWTSIEWTKTTVKAISGTNITFEFLIHFRNGTEQANTRDIDIKTGRGFPFYFISADLTAGDTTYAGDVNYAPGPTINETIFVEYLGILRKTNHLNITRFLEDYFGWRNYSESYNLYWDRITGVLVEYSYQRSFLSGTENFVTFELTSFIIVDTNLWKAPIPTTIDDLKTEIEELGFEREIDNRGMVRSLIAKLNAAQKLVNKGKIDKAKSILQEGFIPQVQELTSIHISIEAADILIQSAEYIISHL